MQSDTSVEQESAETQAVVQATAVALLNDDELGQVVGGASPNGFWLAAGAPNGSW